MYNIQISVNSDTHEIKKIIFPGRLIFQEVVCSNMKAMPQMMKGGRQPTRVKCSCRPDSSAAGKNCHTLSKEISYYLYEEIMKKYCLLVETIRNLGKPVIRKCDLP